MGALKRIWQALDGYKTTIGATPLAVLVTLGILQADEAATATELAMRVAEGVSAGVTLFGLAHKVKKRVLG